MHFDFISTSTWTDRHILCLYVSWKWFFVTLIQSCGSVKWFHFSLCPLGCEYFHKARKANYFGHWYKLNLTFDVGIKSVILKICKTDEILFRSHAIIADLNPFQFAMLIVKAKIIIIFFLKWAPRKMRHVDVVFLRWKWVKEWKTINLT